MRPRQIGSLVCSILASVWTLLMTWQGVHAFQVGLNLMHSGPQNADYLQGAHLGLNIAIGVLALVWLVPAVVLLLLARSMYRADLRANSQEA